MKKACHNNREGRQERIIGGKKLERKVAQIYRVTRDPQDEEPQQALHGCAVVHEQKNTQLGLLNVFLIFPYAAFLV